MPLASSFRLSFLAFGLVILSGLADAAANAPEKPSVNLLAERDVAGVAIVVNDAAVTNGDIWARYGLALLSSGLPDNPENRGRIMPQIVRGLIEEQLQLQEARRQQIEVSPADIDQALARIGQENNMPGGDIRAFLRGHGIAPRTIEQQARAQIAWARLVQRQLRPRVEVSDDEADEIVARMKAAQGKTEYFVNEIFLPVDDPEQEEAVRGFAQKLLKQIRQTGAFGAIARQFSQGAGAPNGGEIGWVQEGTLAAEINTALTQAKPGDLLGPVKSAKGYHILALRDMRRIAPGGDAGIMVKLAQVGRGVPPQQMKSVAAATREKTAKLQGCAEIKQNFPAREGWEMRVMPEQSVAALPPALAPLARNLDVGKAGDLDIQPNGLGFIVVCERRETGGFDRQIIMNNIGSERLENLARALLRDLKRNAYIDVRI